MTKLLPTALAFGLLAALSAPAFAACPGHVSAEAKDQIPTTTADTGAPLPPPAGQQG